MNREVSIKINNGVEDIGIFATPMRIVYNEQTIKIAKNIKTNIKEYIGNDIYALDLPEIIEMKKIMEDNANEMMKVNNYNYKIKVSRGWLNSKKYGEDETPHNHGSIFLISVLYVQVGPKTGDLHLMCPFNNSEWALRDRYHEKQDARMFHRFTPKEGAIIFFPGYMIHAVEKNMNPAVVRKSVATNLYVDDKGDSVYDTGYKRIIID